MSPEPALPAPETEHVVLEAVASAGRRARLLAIAESIAWGAVAAAISPAAGVLTAAAVAAWRWRATSHASIVRALERAVADARNLFVTADELARDALIVKPAIRARVFADAAVRAQRLDMRAVFPIARVVYVALFAALAWTAVETAHLWRGQRASIGLEAGSTSTPPLVTEARSRLQVTVGGSAARVHRLEADDGPRS